MGFVLTQRRNADDLICSPEHQDGPRFGGNYWWATCQWITGKVMGLTVIDVLTLSSDFKFRARKMPWHFSDNVNYWGLDSTTYWSRCSVVASRRAASTLLAIFASGPRWILLSVWYVRVRPILLADRLAGLATWPSRCTGNWTGFGFVLRRRTFNRSMPCNRGIWRLYSRTQPFDESTTAGSASTNVLQLQV